MTTTATRERVQRGAKLLDEKKPGWRDLIDIETLDLASSGRCVLGQVYGGYYRGGAELFCGGLWNSEALDCTRQHGFEASVYAHSINSEVVAVSYAMLNAAWREELVAA